MAHYHKYAVLKLCPDAARGELFNVGLVVFKRDGSIDIEITKNRRKISAVDGAFNVDLLDNLASNIRKVLDGISGDSDRLSALKQSVNIRLSDMGQILDDPSVSYDQIKKNIYTRLVEPYKSEPKTRGSRLTTEVKQLINRLDLMGHNQDDIDHHRFVQSYRVPESEQVIDFAFKNGSYRLYGTVDARRNPAEKAESMIAVAARLAASAKIIQRSLQTPTETNLIYAANIDQMDALSSAMELVEKQDLGSVLNFAETQDRRSLEDQLSQLALTA